MKSITGPLSRYRTTFIIGTLMISIAVFSFHDAFSQTAEIRGQMIPVGVARTDITPEIPIRMAGYASRVSTEADSVLQPISAKALALGSDEQHPSVLITVDLVGIPWRITQRVSDYLTKEMGVDPAQIAICASHTHGGPEVGNLINILQARGGHFSDSLLALDQLIHIAEYTEQLTKKLKDVATAALKSRQPAYVSWGQGQALFAANRRTKGGPVDVALPILKIENPDGSLKAVFVNYACHGTTLGGNVHKIHGDWIAEAQRVIEQRHPGTIALIALGCAGDANPAPRGTLQDVKDHGKEIADNVDKLLSAQLQPLSSPPTGKMKWVDLPYEHVPTIAELIPLSKGNSVKAYYARLALERLVRGEQLPKAQHYPVQVWNFDDKMAMVNLAGEVVVDYSIRLKDRYGAEQLWVNAYSNDVPSYIASRRVLKEGGYEAESSMYWYNRPSPYAPEVEDIIVEAVDDLMPEVFKTDRPDTNHQELVQQGDQEAYDLFSWLAATDGDHVKYMPEWKAFGWFNIQDKVVWKVDLKQSGRYDVYIDYSVSDESAGKSFRLKIGKKSIRDKVKKTGSWFTYRKEKIGTIRLSKGVQEVTLSSGGNNEEGSMFDLRQVRLVLH